MPELKSKFHGLLLATFCSASVVVNVAQADPAAETEFKSKLRSWGACVMKLENVDQNKFGKEYKNPNEMVEAILASCAVERIAAHSQGLRAGHAKKAVDGHIIELEDKLRRYTALQLAKGVLLGTAAELTKHVEQSHGPIQ